MRCDLERAEKFGTNQEGILVETKGSKVRTPKITFSVVDTHVEQKLVE